MHRQYDRTQKHIDSDHQITDIRYNTMEPKQYVQEMVTSLNSRTCTVNSYTGPPLGPQPSQMHQAITTLTIISRS